MLVMAIEKVPGYIETLYSVCRDFKRVCCNQLDTLMVRQIKT